MHEKTERTTGIWIVTVVAIIFGLLTVITGFLILFAGGKFQEGAGDYVSFVLWFNFLMGFVYLITGGGLWMQKSWAVWTSIFIVFATLVVYVMFGIYMLNGGIYEFRTVVAMGFRFIIWASIAVFAYQKIPLNMPVST